MSSQPSGGPAIPTAAAVAGLSREDDQANDQMDEGVPVGAADVEADIEQGRDDSDEDGDGTFVTADTADTPASPGAEADRRRASDEE